jgi:molybdate transport repressor ModE-like protein
MADLSPTDLRVLREVAERGSFSAAARALGYSQSAVSRRAAALEAVAGRPLFERRREGVVLTHAGRRLLGRAVTVLDELDRARRELDGQAVAEVPVRLGAFATAAATLVPAALVALAARHPELDVRLREGTTPALVRALRAGTVDLAVLAASPPFRPLDAEAPALSRQTLDEGELLVAVGAAHPLAGRGAVELEELEGRRWIASGPEAGATLLGVWPGLSGRPDVAHTARDWWAKLELVAAGLGITTVPAIAAPAMRPDVHLVAVRGEPRERRRVVLACLPGRVDEPALLAVADALLGAARRAS